MTWSRRLDVGIEPEQIDRVVALLERCESRIVVTVGCMDPVLRIIGNAGVDVEPGRKRLEPRPDAAHPLRRAFSTAMLVPESDHHHVTGRRAMPVRGGSWPHTTDRSAQVGECDHARIERRALKVIDGNVDYLAGHSVKVSGFDVVTAAVRIPGIPAALQLDIRHWSEPAQRGC